MTEHTCTYYIPVRMIEIRSTNTTKCWWGYKATGTLRHCWGCRIVQLLWKWVWQFIVKHKLHIVKHILSTFGCNLIPSLVPHKNSSFYTKICTSFTCNNPNLITTQMLFNKWIDKQTALQPYHKILSSSEKNTQLIHTELGSITKALCWVKLLSLAREVKYGMIPFVRHP